MINFHKLGTANDPNLFIDIVSHLKEYVIDNDLHALILGISGGLDSAVCAAICHETVKKVRETIEGYEIKFIGRSLPILNSITEITNANLVGEAFCDDYCEFMLSHIYNEALDFVTEGNSLSLVQKGNIQARLRMMYLYNLASQYKGIVVDPLNYTEYRTGFWTIHGDEGDIHPIWQLYKTEVYELARNLVEIYIHCKKEDKAGALQSAIDIIPTDGLGISTGDMERFKCQSYQEVDEIIYTLDQNWADPKIILGLVSKYGIKKVEHIRTMIDRSNFKRMPFYHKFSIDRLR